MLVFCADTKTSVNFYNLEQEVVQRDHLKNTLQKVKNEIQYNTKYGFKIDIILILAQFPVDWYP